MILKKLSLKITQDLTEIVDGTTISDKRVKVSSKHDMNAYWGDP
jgi:hypothetical protein